MSLALHTLRFSRRRLPHWEVENGRYFVTVRCADSLPHEAWVRVQTVHSALAETEPRSEAFAALQRQYFQTLEKYLDRGHGACCLSHPSAASVMIAELKALCEWGVHVPHFSIMPNHWHAIVEPTDGISPRLGLILRRIKGRSSRRINQLFGIHGGLWQREWFDRWIRDDAEYKRCVRYIQDNPMKAGVCRAAGEHQWTQ